MCLLPEGEPRATPFYLADFEELFGPFANSCYNSKSGIPIITGVIPRKQIPLYANAKKIAYHVLIRKRTEWAQLAARPELNPGVATQMTGDHDEVFRLGFLSLLTANATSRIDEYTASTTGDGVDIAAVATIEHFKDVFSREKRHITVAEVYEHLAQGHSHDAVAGAIEILTHFKFGWFMPLGVDPEAVMIPNERFDWFEDHYGPSEIEKNGLVAIVLATADDWAKWLG